MERKSRTRGEITRKMAEAHAGGDSSDEEPTIADDIVVTKYKMAGDMANRKNARSFSRKKPKSLYARRSGATNRKGDTGNVRYRALRTRRSSHNGRNESRLQERERDEEGYRESRFIYIVAT